MLWLVWQVNAPLNPDFGLNITEIGTIRTELEFRVLHGDIFYSQLEIPSQKVFLYEKPPIEIVKLSPPSFHGVDTEICFNGPQLWIICVDFNSVFDDEIELQVEEYSGSSTLANFVGKK